MDWSTLKGSADLPSFVEHLNGAQFKAGLRGTVRMETPVLYFYSLATHDLAGLQKYNRFLEPILEEMKAENPSQARQIERDLDLTYRTPTVEPQTAK